MKLNVCTISFRHHLISFEQIAHWAKRHHFNGIELWGVHAKNMDARMEYGKSWLSQQNLSVPMISDYLPLAGDADTAIAKATSLGILCEYWGAKKLRTFAGNRSSHLVSKEERSLWTTRLRKLCDVAREFGVYLVVETHPNTLADTLESTLQLIEEVNHPALRINFDVIHVWECGSDPVSALKALEPLVVHIHLKNITDKALLNVFNPGNVYAPAGDRSGMVKLFEGAFDFNGFLAHLKQHSSIPWQVLDASLEWFGADVCTTLEADCKLLREFGFAVNPVTTATQEKAATLA
ncbi:family 2 AP endonuclease [Oleiphilus messinensis]|uniref:Family 2 AP endonuclease n=1 Tax=Oleiphilus messinensis TaxID=141451 RepID=A0A1Y0I2F0_9GAMM|nr:sugar phosphate isomerase/epimerase [Oleiphilus messinensis]ARU54642.1 family 2 AP endonuclease [Oleiphilus messinensis]